VGSGVYIGDRYVLTAAHVILDGNGVPRQTSGIGVELDSQRISRRANLTGWDKNLDIALVRLESDPGPAVTAQAFRRTGFEGVGETIYAVGYPQGTTGAPIITQGVVSRFVVDTTQPPPVGRVMQYDTATAQGGSGSPVFDVSGRIVSIVQTINVTSSGSGIGLARGIISDEILDAMDALKSGAQR
jgi:S1-C subfamily serine protease